jgi:large subunit ribosomal protein L21
MYAIVSIAGQQFKVEKGKKVFVHRLPGNVGDEVSFDKVLLISNDDKVNVGAPYLDQAVVLAEILSHNRGDKVLVFKKKRRKSYQKLNGHRQDFTQILVQEISESGVPAKTGKKKSAETKVEAKVETKVEETVKVAPAVVKTAKPAAKKTAPKAVTDKPAVEKPKKAAAKKTVEKTEKPAAKKAPAKGKGEKK